MDISGIGNSGIINHPADHAGSSRSISASVFSYDSYSPRSNRIVLSGTYGMGLYCNSAFGNLFNVVNSLNNSIQENISSRGPSDNDFMIGVGSLNGGDGDDTLVGNGVLDGGDGDDFIMGNGILSGSNGNDIIIGHGVLSGGSGDDSIVGRGILSGGSGDDLITGSGYIDGGSGNDRIAGIGDNTILLGGSGHDMITAWGSNIFMSGGSGNDDITSLGSNTIYGGSGDDRIMNGSSESVIYAGSGDDIITSFDVKFADGGSGDDFVKGNGELHGGIGDDIIEGTGHIYGGEGDDIIMANGQISGGTGDDFINLKQMTSLAYYADPFDNVIKYEKGDGSDVVNSKGERSILDMSSISRDDVNISESFNEETGYNEMTVTMKDGSGQVKFVSEKLPELGPKKIGNLIALDLGHSYKTLDEATFVPDKIIFADGEMTF